MSVKSLAIPRSFDLGGHRIRVKINTTDDHDNAGDWSASENTIRLWTYGNSHEYVMQSFLHELAHAILDIWGRPEASSDENLVDVLGQGLLQFLKSARY